MSNRAIVFLIAGFIALVLIVSCLFTVQEHQQAIVFQFGEAKRVENSWGEEPNAGLKVKLPPPFQNVVYVSRRNLEVDLRPVELLASDQERLIVDAFVRYRITDPIRFYEKLRNEQGAQDQLQAIFDSTLRDVLGRVDTPEIISGRRSELMAEISATAEKEATIIRAEAQREAEIIRGEGDGERTRIFAEAFEKDPEFYAFYRSMEAYKKGLGQGTTYVLSPDSDFLGYLDNQQGPRGRR